MPTQTTSIFHPTTAGIEYTGLQTWTVAAGIIVESHDKPGVYSAFGGSKLINKGEVYSADDLSVVFTDSDSTIVNNATGSIYGAGGVAMASSGGTAILNMTLTNHGRIEAFDGTGVQSVDTSNFVLHNDGEIYGHFGDGIYLFNYDSGLTGPTIDNSGLIRSDGAFGIYSDNIGGETTTVINEAGGTIEGAESIWADHGAISLVNHGTLKGQVAAFAVGANNKVINDGTIKGTVLFGPGDDIYKNTGGTAGKVFGGDGNDTLVAGPHTDKFVFDTGLNATTNVDTVKHFDPGTDRLFLDQSVFTKLTGPGTLKGGEFHIGKHAADHTDHIIYNSHSGALYYDPDGTGGAPKVEFAQLDPGLAMSHDDFTVMA